MPLLLPATASPTNPTASIPATSARPRGNYALPRTARVIELGDGRADLPIHGKLSYHPLLDDVRGWTLGVTLLESGRDLYVGLHGAPDGTTSLLSFAPSGVHVGSGKKVSLNAVRAAFERAGIKVAGFFCCYAQAVQEAQGDVVLYAHQNGLVHSYAQLGKIAPAS